MLRLVSSITFDFNPFDPTKVDTDIGAGKLNIDFVNSVQVDASVDSLTDTARIILPRKYLGLLTQGTDPAKKGDTIIQGSNPQFKRGNKVTISLGYDYNIVTGGQKLAPLMNTVFQGYISQVIADAEIEIICEDAMFKLKQVINTGYSTSNTSSIKLLDLLNVILPSWCKGSNLNCIDAVLGSDYRVKAGNSVAFELDRLTDLGFSFNFNNGVLFANLRYVTKDPLSAIKTELKYERNIISDDNMVYKRKDDLGIGLKCISTNSKNVVVGPIYFNDTYPNGTSKTITLSGDVTNYKNNLGMDLATLTRTGQEMYERFNFEGFTGYIETFLQPTIMAGNAVKLLHDNIPEKNGIYLVKKVITSFGANIGGRQKIYLDRRIDIPKK